MKWSYPLASLIILATSMYLISCTPQTNVEQPAVLVDAPLEVMVEVTPEASTNFDAEFTLKTVAENGKLLYIGVGGEIDGVINPDLVVQPEYVVHVILVNGDGMPHDLFLQDWDIKSDYVMKIGDETEIVIEVGEKQPGSYVYYCTVPGHRQAGQEGKLIVENFEQ